MPHPRPGHEQDTAPDRISSDEVILRRLPKSQPGVVTTIDRPGIGLTATSFSISPHPREEYPSWSRQKLTSPEHLLDLAAKQDIDVAGWSVAAVTVAQVRELGLDVVANSTQEDPGHCLIVPGQQRFTGTVWSKLAKRTRIVHRGPDRAPGSTFK